MRFLFCALGALALAACGEAAAVDDNAIEDSAEATMDGASADGPPKAAETGSRVLDTIPAKFRGSWDVRQGNPSFCTDLSDGIMRVEAKEILFYEAVFTAESIEETSPETIIAEGAFQDLGENSDEIYTLTVRDGGKRLTLAAAGFGIGMLAVFFSERPVTASEYGRLVNAPGVEETFTYCTGCHSEMIVVQQGKSRKNWDALFHWMVEEQGMVEIPEPERSTILDYLAEHYNIDRPNFPR